ncbi:MAG: hypothetical protein V3T56_09830, partial [Gemmatimonadales bacterium]
MRFRDITFVGLLTTAVLGACASGAPTLDLGPETMVVAPLPGDNYAYVYYAGATVGRVDTRTGADVSVADGVTEILASAVNRSGSRTAVAFRQGATSGAVIIDGRTGALTQVHSGSSETAYTLGWSLDGTRLGVGFRGSDEGGILVVEPDGTVNNIGCRASNRFEAFRAPTELIVHDGTNFYSVSTTKCATLATFRKAGKKDMAYSENGRRVSYFQDHRVQFTNREQSQVIAELSVSNYNGAGPQTVADFQSRPADAVLSPDGARIAYEVVSARWANTTHVVIYELSSNEYTYIAEEKQLGVPSDFSACWASDGRRIAHERAYARSTGAQDYVSREILVRDGENEKVVFEEIIDRPLMDLKMNRPPKCQWIGDRYLVVWS